MNVKLRNERTALAVPQRAMLLTPETVSGALQRAAAQDDRNGLSLTLLNQSKLPVTTANSSWPRNWWNRPLPMPVTPRSMPMPPRKRPFRNWQRTTLQKLALGGIALRSEQGNLAGTTFESAGPSRPDRGDKTEAMRLAETALTANKQDLWSWSVQLAADAGIDQGTGKTV